MSKKYFITGSRFKFIGIILLIIWIGFMVFLYLKADEITKNPCSICAEKSGENVICTVGYLQRTYYPNDSIIEKDWSKG